MSATGPVIGIDFDNTLVSYDELIHQVALERGLISSGVERSKRHVRDAIRRLPEGEIDWQKVQGEVYGPRMRQARPAEGVERFLRHCVEMNAKLYVISHKTRFANYDETRTDLRAAALSWMEEHCWLDGRGHSLSRDDIYFESSRLEKLERIQHLGCTYFIDDLEETFLEDRFPSGVVKILYAPYPIPMAPSPPGVTISSSWDDIADRIPGMTR